MEQVPGPPLWSRIRAAADGYANAIVPLIATSYGRDCIQQAWREFILGGDTTFSVDDPHAELFFSWLFHRWAPSRQQGDRVADESLYGVSPTRAYLDSNATSLAPLLRNYLEACLVAPPGFYEVLECRPGAGFDARDLLTGRRLAVDEGLASISLAGGDVIFAHLPCVDGVVLVDSVAPFSFPSLYAARVERHRPRQVTDRSLRKLYFELLESYLASTR
jgi:hypothetical protein